MVKRVRIKIFVKVTAWAEIFSFKGTIANFCLVGKNYKDKCNRSSAPSFIMLLVPY